jgi:hypothetical protein
MREADLFAGAARVTMNEAMEMTAASLGAYAPTCSCRRSARSGRGCSMSTAPAAAPAAGSTGCRRWPGPTVTARCMTS